MTVEGFLVTSDKKRYARLWFVEMKAFIGLMREVGSDYPSSMTGVFNRDKNDWELWQGHGDPPAEFVRREQKILQDQWIADGRSEYGAGSGRSASASLGDPPPRHPAGRALP